MMNVKKFIQKTNGVQQAVGVAYECLRCSCIRCAQGCYLFFELDQHWKTKGDVIDVSKSDPSESACMLTSPADLRQMPHADQHLDVLQALAAAVVVRRHGARTRVARACRPRAFRQRRCATRRARGLATGND